MSPIHNEQEFEVSFPRTHELSGRVSDQPKPGEEPFRTKAAVLLKQIFGKDIFTLRETTGVSDENEHIFSYRIAVKIPRVEEFRQKVAELGFNIKERVNGSKR